MSERRAAWLTRRAPAPLRGWLQNGYTPHDVPVYTIDEDGQEVVAVDEVRGRAHGSFGHGRRLISFCALGQSSIWIGKLDNEAFGEESSRPRLQYELGR